MLHSNWNARISARKSFSLNHRSVTQTPISGQSHQKLSYARPSAIPGGCLHPTHDKLLPQGHASNGAGHRHLHRSDTGCVHGGESLAIDVGGPERSEGPDHCRHRRPQNPESPRLHQTPGARNQPGRNRPGRAPCSGKSCTRTHVVRSKSSSMNTPPHPHAPLPVYSDPYR